MKINEFVARDIDSERVDEGPIDFARKVGAGIKGLAQGGFSGAATGYRSKKAEIEQQKLIRATAQNAAVEWAKVQQQIISRGKTPRPVDATNWLRNFMGGVKPLGKPADLSPARVQQWLTQEVANFMAVQSGVVPPPRTRQPKTPPAPTPPAPTPPAPTPPTPTPPTPTPPAPPTPTPTPPAPTPPTPTPPAPKAKRTPKTKKAAPSGAATPPPAPSSPSGAETPTTSAAPTVAGNEPITIGGQKISPKDPLYQKIMKTQKSQSGSPTSESFNHTKSPLYNKLMELQLDEAAGMKDLIAATAAKTGVGQKIAQGLKQTAKSGVGLVGQGLTSAAGSMDSASKIISRFSGAPSIRSFAAATDITSTKPDAEQKNPQAAGTELGVPSMGNAPAKKYSLKGNTYVDSSGKPVSPELNQILMAVNYGKVRRS